MLKVSDAEYDELDKRYLISVRKENYGYSCLTAQKQFYAENYPYVAVTAASVFWSINIMKKKEF